MRWQSGVTRRTLLCNTALGTAALAAGGIGAYAQPASKPPNIVFILADDLGYADVSCYGRRDFTTPNIDRIAARGVRFLQGYANSAVCTATRVALITGRYQYRLRIGLEEPLVGQRSTSACRPSIPTLAVAAEEGGLRHDASSASGIWALCPNFGPLQERLRSLLRLPRRRRRLLLAHRHRVRRRICGTTTCRCIRPAI